MKKFRSEYAFQKHKPQLSRKEKFLQIFKKKKIISAQVQDKFHYKSNPFRPAKETDKTRIKTIVLAILLAAWLVCLVYIPYFKVNKINYSGLNLTTKDELDQFIYDNFLNKKSILPLNNYFFINTEKMAGELNKKFAFETAAITKVFPNQINVAVKEKTSSVIYDNGKKYFLLDSAGTVTKFLKDVEPYEVLQKSATDTVISLLTMSSSTTTLNTSTFEHIPDYKKLNKLFGNYPLIYDKRGLDVDINQEHVLPTSHIEAVMIWFKDIGEQGGVGVKFFTLDDTYSGIAVKTTNPWQILFQPTNNSEDQINVFKQILPTIKPQQYIDLRFGKKVYWK